MNENRKLHAVVLRIAAVLLVLVMLSTSMVAGRYARYTTTASGYDAARIARFSVTESGDLRQTFKVKVSPGEAVPITVQLKNDSEVAVAYTVSAENYFRNLPLEFTVIDTATSQPAQPLAPGETRELALQIFWQEDITDDKYIGMVDLIHLTIRVTQVD